MPSVVPIILPSLLAADMLWWWRADCRVRRWRHAARWRLLIGVFMGGQTLLLLWNLIGRVPEVSFLGRPPQPLSAAGYLWHLLVLPACWLFVAITSLLSWAWAMTRHRPVQADEKSMSGKRHPGVLVMRRIS